MTEILPAGHLKAEAACILSAGSDWSAVQKYGPLLEPRICWHRECANFQAIYQDRCCCKQLLRAMSITQECMVAPQQLQSLPRRYGCTLRCKRARQLTLSPVMPARAAAAGWGCCEEGSKGLSRVRACTRFQAHRHNQYAIVHSSDVKMLVRCPVGTQLLALHLGALTYTQYLPESVLWQQLDAR
jgi:hypothetical protein